MNNRQILIVLIFLDFINCKNIFALSHKKWNCLIPVHLSHPLYLILSLLLLLLMTGGLSLTEWQQVSSALQDSFQYSQQCRCLNGFDSPSDFPFLDSWGTIPSGPSTIGITLTQQLSHLSGKVQVFVNRFVFLYFYSVFFLFLFFGGGILLGFFFYLNFF